MALIFVDGFPYASAQLELLYNNTNTAVYASGRSGGRYIGLGDNCKTIYTLPSALTTLCIQFGYICTQYDGRGVWPNPVMQLIDSATEQIKLWDDYGTFRVKRGATLLGSSSIVHSASTWHQVEFKTTISTTVGTVLLKIDGVTALNLTGVNTQQSANAYLNFIKFGEMSSGQYFFGLSDLILMDTSGSYCNDLLGAKIVAVKLPTGDGNYKQFTPSTGTDHYAVVDELPPNTTDYNSGSVDNIDTFTKSAVANPNANISGVALSIYCCSSDGGTASVAPVARSGSTNSVGSDLTVPSSYTYLQGFIYTDPATSNPFTRSGLDAAEFGYKRTA
jgi:hypothetical protein